MAVGMAALAAAPALADPGYARYAFAPIGRRLPPQWDPRGSLPPREIVGSGQAGLIVVAEIMPCLTVELSENAINFDADHGPGIYDADSTIDIRVATNWETWAIDCSATALTGSSGEIPPERVLLQSSNAAATSSQESEPDYCCMEDAVTIAEGGPQALTLVSTLRFRVETLWEDKAGEYDGTITVTCLPTL
jgi:hypothetical protein